MIVYCSIGSLLTTLFISTEVAYAHLKITK